MLSTSSGIRCRAGLRFNSRSGFRTDFTCDSRYVKNAPYHSKRPSSEGVGCTAKNISGQHQPKVLGVPLRIVSRSSRHSVLGTQIGFSF